VLEKPVVLGSLQLVLNEAGVDKVDEFEAELFPILSRIQARRIAMDNLLQLLEHGVPFWVREPTGGHLNEGYPERPDIGPDVVAFGALRVDSFRRHVGPTSGVSCLCDGIDELKQLFCKLLPLNEMKTGGSGFGISTMIFSDSRFRLVKK